MDTGIYLIGVASVVFLATMLSIKLVGRWKLIRTMNTQKSTADEDDMQEAWTAFVRDVLLILLSVGVAGYLLTGISQSALSGVLGSPSGGPGVAANDGVQSGGIAMVTPAHMLLRLSLGVASFFILAALIYPIVPGIIPVRGNSRLSMIFSAAIAISLASAGALLIVLPSQASDRLIAEWTDKLSWLLAQFITVLVGAVGAYLFWKNIWRHIKPR